MPSESKGWWESLISYAGSLNAPATAPNTNNDLGAFLNQTLAAMGGGATGGADVEDILGQTMLGLSGRRGLTSQPLVGYMPAWVRTNPQLLKVVRAGQIDPYLPTSDPNSWRVFVGRGENIVPPTGKTADFRDAAGLDPIKAGNTGDATEGVASVKNQPYLWTEDQVTEAIQKFQDAGMKTVTTFDDVVKVWGSLTERAGAMYSLSSGKNKVTPWDALDLYKSEISRFGGGGGGGGGGYQAGTRTQVQRTINEISQGDAWAALRQTVSNMLGRDPGDQEVRDFAYRMNSLAAKNPSISTSTITTDANGNVSSSTRSKPGWTGNDIAKGAYDEAQSDPDYAEYQSATTYFNAVLSALGEIGG